MNRIFVYGTLMQAGARADLLGEVQSVVEATTTGRLYGLPFGYPALIDVDDGVAHGELVQVDGIEATLLTLDAYEGDLYRRVRRSVTTRSGDLDAWCYVVDPAEEPRLVAAGALLMADGYWS